MAESICQDILLTDPHDQRALVTMILAITDQFREHGLAGNVARARELVSRLDDEYERLYYEGIIYERRGRAHLAQSRHGSGFLAYDWLTAAMGLFERANQKRPAGNDEAVLRWNACARTLMRHPELQPRHEQRDPSSVGLRVGAVRRRPFPFNPRAGFLSALAVGPDHDQTAIVLSPAKHLGRRHFGPGGAPTAVSPGGG